MNDRQWERWTAIIGFALFVVFNILAAFLAGSVPSVTDPLPEIERYFGDHNLAFRIGAWFGAISVIPHLFWVGVVFRRTRAAEGGDPLFSAIMLAGAVLGAAVAAVGQAVVALGAVEFRDGRIDAATMQFYYKFQILIDGAAFMGAAILTGAVAIVVFRHGLFARWVGWLSLVTTVALVISSWGMAEDGDFIFDFALYTITLLGIWTAAVTYYLVRRPREAVAA